jgi:opacity protein-like surface antigen
MPEPGITEATMRKTSLGLVIIALLLGGPAAHAQEDDEGEGSVFHRDGGYFGLSGVAGMPVSDFGERRATGGGVNGRLGWHGTGWLSFEMEGEYIYGMYTEVTDKDWQAVTLTGNFKFSAPLGRFQPYLTPGLGLMYAKENGTTSGDSTNFAARFGAGLDFYLTKNWVLACEASYVLPVANLRDRDLDYLTLGVGFLYRLDGPSL